MELETAFNLLRFTGMWPVKEKKSLCSKLIRFRAAVSQTIFIITMALIVVDWFTTDAFTKDYININVARIFFIFVKEYSSFMFFYRKRKLIEQLNWRCTGGFPVFDLCEEYATREATMRDKLKKRLRFNGNFLFGMWIISIAIVIALRVVTSVSISGEKKNVDFVSVTTFDPKYPLMFAMWWPPGSETNPYSYYALFAMQCSCVFHIVMGMAALNNFIVSVLLTTKERITLLRETAASAFKFAAIGCPENGINKVFEQWLDYRIHLKNVVGDINDVLGGILYLAISNCVVAITLLSYVITLVPGHIAPSYAIIIAVFLMETLVFCLVGQGIIREGQKLCDEVQDQVRAFLKRGATRECNLADTMQFLLADCSEDMQPFIDVKGIYKLSLALFFKLLYSSFGYMTTLLQFRHSKQT